MSTAPAQATVPAQSATPQAPAQMPNIPKEEYVGSGAIFSGLAYGGASYLGADLAHKGVNKLGWFEKKVEEVKLTAEELAKRLAVKMKKSPYPNGVVGEDVYDATDKIRYENEAAEQLKFKVEAEKQVRNEFAEEAELALKNPSKNKWVLATKIALGVLAGGYGVIKALSAKGQHDMLEAQRNEAVANNFMVVGEANKQLQSAGEQLHVLQQEKAGLEQQVAAHKTWADKVGKGEPSHANSLENMLHDAAAHAHPVAHTPVAAHPAAIGDHTSALAHAASAPAHDTALGHAAQHAPAADTHAGDIAHAKATAPAAHQFG